MRELKLPPSSSPDTKSGDLYLQKRCNHPIYCDGPILKSVQLAGVFDEDKTFVDMPTRKPVKDIVSAFSQLPANASKDALTQFVNDNFYPAGSDIEVAVLEDWTDNPPFLDGVTDPVLRGYGMALHNQWKKLARRQSTKPLCDGCETSLLPVNHTFITSGSNSSRELHYWDTYYIELGLLKSGLYKTAKGVLQNLLDLVNVYGFVPTGGRIYYTDRSEPPLLALMVKTYYDATKDLDFVARALPLLKKEHTFWETYRGVNVTYTRNATISLGKRQADVSQVVTSRVSTFGPNLIEEAQTGDDPGSDSQQSGTTAAYIRPEEYRNDVVLASTQFSTPDLISEAVSGSDLYAASEAGTTPGIQYTSPSTIRTTPDLVEMALRRRSLTIDTDNPFANFTSEQLEILGSVAINDTIAVNLNAILYQAEIIIADFCTLVNNGTSADESVAYRNRAEERWQTLFDLTYNPKTGMFSDYHIGPAQQTNIWSMSALWPYWAFGDKVPADGAKLALATISDLHDRFPGGLPNTFYNTSLGWDFPNVHPPLQHVAINSVTAAEKRLGADSSVSSKFTGIAVSIVQSSINSAFCNWYTSGGSITGVLDSFGPGSSGGVGVSYESYQLGPDGNILTTTNATSPGDYSWTNGITLWLFDQYKTQIQLPKCPNIELKLVDTRTATSAAPAPTLPVASPKYSTAPATSASPTAVPPTSTPVTTPPATTSAAPTSSPPPPQTTCVVKRKCSRCKCRVKRKGLFRRKALVRT
ncbi:Six-hairpin glycosidase [Martensiomyces pterosporus]|nr:Six-hairpin glycosidase [Martensiomyces pterosporus]